MTHSSETVFHWLVPGVAMALSACTNTPIDVVVTQGSGALVEGQAGGGVVAAGGSEPLAPPITAVAGRAGGGSPSLLDAPVAGGPGEPPAEDAGADAPDVACGERALQPVSEVFRLQLVDSLECLTTGERTTVVDLPAFETALDPACASNEGLFELIVNEFAVYEVRSVAVDFNLDVKQASTRSGTPLVLFGAHRLDNQRFHFNHRDVDTFEIAPASVPTQCVTRMPDGLQIWPCDALDATQEWYLLGAECD